MSMQTIKWILYYDEDWDSRNGFTLPRYYTFSFIIINLWLVCFYDYFTRNEMITKNFFVLVFFNQRLRISGEVTNNHYLSFNELKKEDVSITIECLLSSFLTSIHYRALVLLTENCSYGNETIFNYEIHNQELSFIQTNRRWWILRWFNHILIS